MKKLIWDVAVFSALFIAGFWWGQLLSPSGDPATPIEYRVVCLMPLTQGEKPTTKLILHDVQTKNRTSADIVGSDGSYRPMLGELCFFQGTPPSDG
jgi:hypothetical protein